MSEANSNQNSNGEPKNNEVFKKFTEMMVRSGIEVPDDFGGAADFSGYPGVSDEFRAMIFSEEFSTSNDALLTIWASERFEFPDDAIRALRRGENLLEASAALFYYCYYYPWWRWGRPAKSGFRIDSWFKAGHWEWFYLPTYDKTPDRYKALFDKWTQWAKTIDSQLDDIRVNFSPDEVKYPETQEVLEAKPYIEILIRTALLILTAQNGDEYSAGNTELVTSTYQLFKTTGINDSSFSKLHKEVIDGKARISGDIFRYLSELACGILCASYGHIASKSKRDYMAAFLAYCEAIPFLLSQATEVGDVLLPYSGSGLLEPDFLRDTIETWGQVKKQPKFSKDLGDAERAFRSIRALVLEADWQYEDIDGEPVLDYIKEQEVFCEVYKGCQNLIRDLQEKLSQVHREGKGLLER